MDAGRRRRPTTLRQRRQRPTRTQCRWSVSPLQEPESGLGQPPFQQSQPGPLPGRSCPKQTDQRKLLHPKWPASLRPGRGLHTRSRRRTCSLHHGTRIVERYAANRPRPGKPTGRPCNTRQSGQPLRRQRPWALLFLRDQRWYQHDRCKTGFRPDRNCLRHSAGEWQHSRSHDLLLGRIKIVLCHVERTELLGRKYHQRPGSDLTDPLLTRNCRHLAV